MKTGLQMVFTEFGLIWQGVAGYQYIYGSYIIYNILFVIYIDLIQFMKEWLKPA